MVYASVQCCQRPSQTRAATCHFLACEAGLKHTQVLYADPLPLSQLPFIVEFQEAPVDDDELVTHVTVGGMGLP